METFPPNATIHFIGEWIMRSKKPLEAWCFQRKGDTADSVMTRRCQLSEQMEMWVCAWVSQPLVGHLVDAYPGGTLLHPSTPPDCRLSVVSLWATPSCVSWACVMFSCVGMHGEVPPLSVCTQACGEAEVAFTYFPPACSTFLLWDRVSAEPGSSIQQD